MTARSAIIHGLFLCAILLPLLILLKLAGGIAWSWWWVLIPLWTPFAVLLVFLAGFAVMATGIAIAAVIAEIFERY
jgi:hypothetical protein